MNRVERLVLLAGLLLATAAGATERTVWVGGSTPSLEAELDGRPVGVSVEPLSPPTWEIVLYLDQTLSRSRSLHQAADLLLEIIEPLSSLGTVEIVRADPGPLTASPPTADRAVLETALYEVLFRLQGRNRLREARNNFFNNSERNEATSTAALADEIRQLREQQDNLLTWMSERGESSSPRLLLLVSDGLALEPRDFYPSEAGTELPASPSPEEIVQVAASFGWTLAPLAVPPERPARRIDLTRSVDLPVGVRIGVGRDRSEDDEPQLASDAELGLDPLPREALEGLARATGGELVRDDGDLRSFLEQLAQRRPVGIDFPDERRGEVLGLRVTAAGQNRELPAPRRLGAGPPELLAALRLRSLLGSLGDEGELAVSCLVEFDPDPEARGPSRLLAQVELSEDESTRLRVSTGVQRGDGRLLLSHRTVEAPPGELWSWRDELQLADDTEAVVLLVEDLGGELWGTTFARFVRSLPDPEQAQIERYRPPGRLIRLDPLPPQAERSRLAVSAQVDPTVARIAFLVDGEEAVSMDEPPYEARVKLGRRSQAHVIEAIAYDGSGSEIDRDAAVFNAPPESFWVRIIEPRSGEHVGPIEVEADVRVPAGTQLDRVDFYWGGRLVATSREAPHRRTLLIPFSDPAGFIRVEARLSDGTTTDDLVLMNSTRFGGHVEVEIVELLVVVTDERGEPVRGLSRSDFEVFDHGELQEIETFQAAGDLPITVGLAIDSSLSLFKRFPSVQRAAQAFVSSLMEDRDHAFLVGFGRDPRVVQRTTGELHRVGTGIGSLEPSGLTMVWEGIVLSLLELEQADGRKALVVFYDGDEEDEKASYRTAVELAERQRVPVYLIVMNNAAARSDGQSFRIRSFTRRLEELAQAGGGRVFYVPTDADLSEVFEAISNELRSHYQLTYYVDPEDQPWRQIEIRMRRKGLHARTISGYRPDFSP